MKENAESAALGRWMQNELDIVETYKLALGRLHGAQELRCVDGAMRQHAAYARELRQLYRALTVTSDPAFEAPHACTRERLAMTRLDSDAGIVAALRESERRRLRAYEAASARPGVTPLIGALIKRSIAAERRQVAALDACRAPASTTPVAA